MERRRRTRWTGRPRPQLASAHGASATLPVTTFSASPTPPPASDVHTSSKILSSTTCTGSAVRDGFLTFLTGLPAVFPESLPRVRLGRTNGSTCNTPFLTGSGSQTEFAVTPSKQRSGTFLTGARTAIKLFEILQLRTQEFTRRGVLKLYVTRGFNAFLTETERHSEIAVTHSKQTTPYSLTETRIAHYKLAAQLLNSRTDPVLLARNLPLIELVGGSTL